MAVILIKTYIDRTRGNLYPASPTPIDELLLPPEIRDNPEYVQPVGSKTKNLPADDLEVQTVRIERKDDEEKPSIEIKQEVVYEEAKEQLEKININEASFDDLIKIPHVGKAIANKIIQERNKQLFTSIEDVVNRVPTKFGVNWSEIITVDIKQGEQDGQ